MYEKKIYKSTEMGGPFIFLPSSAAQYYMVQIDGTRY